MKGNPAVTLVALQQPDSVIFTAVGVGVVDPAQHAVALATLHQSAAMLGIEPPQLCWFDTETDAEQTYADRYGFRDWEWFPGDPRLMGLYVAPLHEVWVRCGLSPVETVRTVAHEVRHAVRDGASREVREAEADNFAAIVEAAFTN